MLKVLCQPGRIAVFILFVLLCDLQQDRLSSTDESVLSTTWGGYCRDCEFLTYTCQSVSCQPYDISGYWYQVSGSLAVEARCFDPEAGESGGTYCSATDKIDCLTPYLCSDEGCTNCLLQETTKVDSTCTVGGDHCVVE